MTTETAAKRDIQKLQRAIVDGLEDVKAQDIQVFDTEHLSSLFERVIVASGTSNRQTKALAASVRDAVREAGFPKPRTEGEANGEWIIVDCAQAVVHIMQPTFRTYYHLEELWGEKPVRLKFGTAKPIIRVPVKVAPVKRAVGKKVAAKGVVVVKAAPVKARVAKAATAGAAASGPVAKTVRKARAGAAPAVAVKAPKARAPARARSPSRKTPSPKA